MTGARQGMRSAARAAPGVATLSTRRGVFVRLRVQQRSEGDDQARLSIGPQVAELFDRRLGTISQPQVELRRFLQLLSALAQDDEEARVDLGNRGHVAPELLELQHRYDVLLPEPPPLLHVLEDD